MKKITSVFLLLVTCIVNYSQTYVPETLSINGSQTGSQIFTAYRSIYADANIINNSNEMMSFVSNGTINLLPGFYASNGSNFHALINDIGNLVNIDNVVVPSSIGLNQKLEALINLSNFSKNPYSSSDIDLYAIITSPSLKQYRVNAFYFMDYDYNPSDCQVLSGGDYGNSYYESKKLNPLKSDWRIRFAPKETGTWKMKIYCILDGKIQIRYPDEISFKCVSSPNAGFIKVSSNKKTLQFENGTPLFLIGENMEHAFDSDYTASNKTVGVGCESLWGEKVNPNYKTGGICMFSKWIQELSEAGGNYIRLGNNNMITWSNGTLQYDSRMAYRIDKYIEKCSSSNVNVKLCLIPQSNMLSVIPDKSFFNLDSETYRIFKDYLRYMVARYGYATNIALWEICDEPFMIAFDEKGKTTMPKEGSPAYINNYGTQVLNWYLAVKNYIKQIDLNHLVSSGGISWGCGWRYDLGSFEYRLAQISDLIEIHWGDQFSFVNDANGKESAIQDLCSLPILVTGKCQNEPANICTDESGRFYSDLVSLNSVMNKPVIMNSFWSPGSNGFCRSDHFLDPYGIYIHNAMWLSLFSNSVGTAAHFYASQNMHPGYYRKSGYFNLYYCIENHTDKGLDFNPGQLNHFKQINQFAKNIDFSVNWESISSDLYSDEISTRPNIRVVALRNSSKTLFYGWLQDKNYQYKYLLVNNCNYLKSLNEGKPQPIFAKLTLKVSEAGHYQITWYRINHDGISIENVSTSESKDFLVTFINPQFGPNSIYGDMAFIIKKVQPEDHYAEFKVNGIVDPIIDICGASPIFLTAYNTYKAETNIINIQECDRNMIAFGRKLEYATPLTPINFDIRAYCSQNNFSLQPGHYYKIKLSLFNPYNSVEKILCIKNQAVPDFKIKDACGNWVQKYNDGYVVIDNTDGSPLWVDANITDCANKYEVIVQECDVWWNRYSFCKSWGRSYEGHPGIFDVQQLMRNTVEGFDIIGGKLDNGLDRYYKIQIATNEPDGNWTPKTILVRREPINCSSSSNLKSVKATSDSIMRFEQSDEDQLLIYPNPSKGKFHLVINEQSSNNIKSMQIFNNLGEIVYSKKNIPGNSIDIDISSCTSGVYVIKVQINLNVVMKKIIIY